ncbi:MAG: nucleotidyltransferase family protein [Acidobacteriota bacterium]
MIQLIADNRRALENLCLRYRVRRLELFGSATGEGFDPESSDLDFLVEFQKLRDNEYADAYFGLLEDLKALFQREVDLVVDSAVKNPYFRQGIDRSRTLLYAA